jgi:hypothetical protein
MRLKSLCLCTLLLSSSALLAEGEVKSVTGKAFFKKISEPSRLFPLKKGMKTQTSSYFKTNEFSTLTLELADLTRITASSHTHFYIVEEHEHFSILLKEGNIRVKAIQRLNDRNTRKVVVKTLRARVESSLGEFIVAYMPAMEHTSVYGLSGLTHFNSKQNFTKEQSVQIYANDESELTSLKERPVSTSKISEKKKQTLEAFFQPSKKQPKS